MCKEEKSVLDGIMIQNEIDLTQKLLNELDVCIYIIDSKTDELIFINDKVRKELGCDHILAGENCQKMLRTESVENCNTCSIYGLGTHTQVESTWEEYNSVTKRYYKKGVHHITWIDGRMVLMYCAYDITDLKKAQSDVEHNILQQEIMSDISRNFMKSDSVDLLIRQAFSIAGGFSHYDRVLIELYDDNTDAFVLADEWCRDLSKSYEPECMAQLIASASYFHNIFALQEQKILTINADNICEFPGLSLIQLQSVVIMPMLRAGKLIGLIEFIYYTKPMQWTRSDIYLGTLLASAFCCIISQQQIKKDLYQMTTIAKHNTNIANTDYLSKLMSRRAMDIFLSEKVRTLSKDTLKSFIFMLDIDNFKSVNDTYGHDIGDKVIVEVGSAINEVIIDGNAARWGGEEFLVFYQTETKAQAIDASNQILMKFMQKKVYVSENHFLTCTISCGISEIMNDEAYINAVIRADKALYIAKNEGKNCTRYIDADANENTYKYFESGDFEDGGNSNVFSSLYNDIMTQIIRTFFYSSNITIVIQELLKIVTIYTGLDRAMLLEKEKDGTYEMTYKYDPDNTVSSYTMPPSVEGWYSEAALALPKFVSDVDFAFGDKKYDLLTGIKAYARFPVYVKGQKVGMLRFDNCHDFHDWSPDERRIFGDLSVFIGEIITKRELEQKLDLSKTALTTVLDSIDDIVYVMDYETQKILFANKTLQKEYGDINYSEKTCNQIFNVGNNDENAFCNHKILMDRDGHILRSSYRHDEYHKTTDRWYDVTEALVDWENGKKAVVEVCRNITARKKAIDELEVQKDFHDLTMKCMNSFSWQITTDLKHIQFNPSIFDALGYEPDFFENSFEKYVSYFVGDGYEKALGAIHDFIDGKTLQFIFSHGIKTADGGVVELAVRGNYYSEDRTVIGGVSTDMSTFCSEMRSLAKVYHKSNKVKH